MEENNNTTPAQKKGMSTGIIVVVLIAILAVAGFVYASNNQTQEVAREEQTPTGTMTAESTTAPSPEAMTAQTESAYKDGTYTATGEYQSPGGAESIEVELTLADGVVTASNVVSKAQRPISKQKQTDFIGGYKTVVEGKNIDEVNLDVVSGASLTPKGFNDAVEKIKQQAQA